MPNPWVSIRCNQLILVNRVVNEKEQLAKGDGARGEEELF
jgi:hypothetical protein